jgi:hypothetical protein
MFTPPRSLDVYTKRVLTALPNREVSHDKHWNGRIKDGRNMKTKKKNPSSGGKLGFDGPGRSY